MDKDIIVRINNSKTIRHNKDSEYSIYLRTTQRMMANPRKTNNNTATPTPK